MAMTTSGPKGHAAPETPEQHLAEVTSGHGMGSAMRSARGHGAELRGLGYVPASTSYEGRFGRMFRLPPFTPPISSIIEVAALMIEGESAADRSLDNPEIPAGYTYLGQFIDHDLTANTDRDAEISDITPEALRVLDQKGDQAGKLGIIRQMLDLDPSRPVSSLPAMTRDLSIAVDREDDGEDMIKRVERDFR